MNEAELKPYGAGFNAGYKEAEADIVAWMLRKADAEHVAQCDGYTGVYHAEITMALRASAAAIARGEHRKGVADGK